MSPFTIEGAGQPFRWAPCLPHQPRADSRLKRSPLKRLFPRYESNDTGFEFKLAEWLCEAREVRRDALDIRIIRYDKHRQIAARTMPPRGLPESAGRAQAGMARRSEIARSEVGDTNPYPLRPAPSPWTRSAGTIVPASPVTGLNSDWPRTVIAQVTENVRDGATGRTVPVPQGARLIGSYDSAVAYGQGRALLVWQRIIFPDGSSVRLDAVPATDLSGFQA